MSYVAEADLELLLIKTWVFLETETKTGSRSAPQLALNIPSCQFLIL